MSVKINAQTPVEVIGAIVYEALRAKGIDCILTGGAVVSIYTHNEYESYDLDFVLPGLAKNVDSIMLELGFKKDKSRHWVHPATPYFVEFPGSILAIGEETKIEMSQLTTKAGKLKLLSPTSSVMDRLAAYYHWNDRQGLDQAVLIAQKHPVKLSKIKDWSEGEGQRAKFDEFLKLIKKGKV